MGKKCDMSFYYVDFSRSDTLSTDQKVALEKIQQIYLPLERAMFLGEYRDQGLITNEEYSTMTGIPYGQL